MIDLKNGWKIDTYDGGYVAANKFSTQVDKKTGKERTLPSNPSYFSTLSNALSFAFAQSVKEKLGSHRKDIDMEKAVQDIKEVFTDFETLLAPLKKLEKWGFNAPE